MSTPVVAIVGRPNVGKSALFNRIVGRDTAIVSEEAGTTRDRHFARAEWQGRDFFLVDTGGITDDERAPLDAAIRHQVDRRAGAGDHAARQDWQPRAQVVAATFLEFGGQVVGPVLRPCLIAVGDEA